ncbi:TPA: RNA 3'-terminal phosphate cyclase [Candidatus Woesearchaeota archaeon]|nr:RNA 3'-terminal phosphate cyclase [Candidatus Woesearchaeota archaeon]
MMEIDGSYGGGGGQIIRTALAFSMLTQQPFHAIGIRKGRTEPGLKPQHLHCIKALQKLSQSRAEGAELGSTELAFHPAPLKAQSITVNIGTAGSTTLLLQAILLPCLFAEKPITLTLRGGTDVKWATPIDHFARVLVPRLQRFAGIAVDCKRRGYFPRGNGLVEIAIAPKIHHDGNFLSLLKIIKDNADPYALGEQGKLVRIEGISHASAGLKEATVAERQAHAAKAQLLKHYPDTTISIGKDYQETDSAGSGITLWATFDNGAILGADVLGERGLQSEEVGKRAASGLIGKIRSRAAVDSHTADQLIPFLALAGGTMKTSAITPHAETNIYAVERFMGKVISVEKGTSTLSANGA